MLGSLSAGEWGCVPTQFLFDVRCPNAGAYRLLGGGRLGANKLKWQLCSQGRMFPSVCHQCLCLEGEPQTPPTPPPLQDTLQDHQVGLPEALIRLLLFLWTIVHVRFHVHHSRVKSLYPPVLWGSQNEALLVFKVKCLRGSSS